jgi:quinol monooxygenase YgiN
LARDLSAIPPARGSVNALIAMASSLLVSEPSRLILAKISRHLTTMITAAVRMTLKWRVVPGEAAAITPALQTILVRTRAELGCLGCSLTEEMRAHIEIRYVVDWESESDLQRQIRSNDFSRLAELMERGTEPPSIEFALPDGIRGMEYAENVRHAR